MDYINLGWLTSYRKKNTSYGNSHCVTVQNFCSSCQTGAQNLKDDILLPNIEKNNLYTNDIIEKTKIILQKLHDYGTLGSRNYPSTNEINSIKIPNDYDITYLQDYAEILKIINLENFSQDKNPIISTENVKKIQEYLKNYKIDYNRCNDCNTTGNCAQCDCDCDCDRCDGGGGGSSGGGCCMYGACGDENSGCHISGGTYCDY